MRPSYTPTDLGTVFAILATAVIDACVALGVVQVDKGAEVALVQTLTAAFVALVAAFLAHRGAKHVAEVKYAQLRALAPPKQPPAG